MQLAMQSEAVGWGEKTILKIMAEFRENFKLVSTELAKDFK